MRCHFGEKRSPDSTKANDGDVKFLHIFAYPFPVVLSNANCFCFFFRRRTDVSNPLTRSEMASRSLICAKVLMGLATMLPLSSTRLMRRISSWD